MPEAWAHQRWYSDDPFSVHKPCSAESLIMRGVRDWRCIASFRCQIKIAIMPRLNTPAQCIISSFGLISIPVDNPIFSPNGVRMGVAFKLLLAIRSPDRRHSKSKSPFNLRCSTSWRLPTLILGDIVPTRSMFRTKVSTIISTLEALFIWTVFFSFVICFVIFSSDSIGQTPSNMFIRGIEHQRVHKVTKRGWLEIASTLSVCISWNLGQ